MNSIHEIGVGDDAVPGELRVEQLEFRRVGTDVENRADGPPATRCHQHEMSGAPREAANAQRVPGGLTTIAEKSLGAVAKAGTTAMTEVYRYAEPMTTRAL